MRLARLGGPGAETPVVYVGGAVYDLSGVTPDIGPEFFALDGLERVRSAVDASTLPVLTNANSRRVGAPIAAPSKIVCIGLNYRDHADETHADIPTEPVIFMKDPSTIIGPNDDVLIPRKSSKTDWEVELGVIIGTEASYLDTPSDAVSCIAAYVLSHDVSEREFQIERGGQWDKGKSCATFNPLGPWLLTADEVPDVQNLGLRLSVNGVTRQNGSTANMIFSVLHLVWYISQFMVLYPGDLINTGTPAGVALGMRDQPYLRADDVVELSIDRLGTARQQFRQA